jgi:threonine dehydrogenase-like Zn-dependent dehydrogenase
VKAVACKEAELSVIDRPAPTPAKGQLLIEVVRCGICGSDLHARHHCDELADIESEMGYEDGMRSDQEVILGHEFSGEILEHGPGTRKSSPTGTPVVAVPLLRRGADVHPIGLSASAPGAYAEHLLIEESLALPVPNGLSPELAALTEPMAVGLHAVRKGEVKKGQVAFVVGCGPIGLAVISMLKASGIRNVVASDFSAARRELGTRCGADLVVDPAAESPYDAAGDRGHIRDMPSALGTAMGLMANLVRLPVGWWHLWRAAETLGVKPKAPVIFECVGVPGMIDQIISTAPLFSRVVVVGVCMGNDQIRPTMAINKEIELRFVLGYTPLEFRDTLHMLADGKVDPRPLITGVVGLPGVDAAFSALGDPERHAKILIDPKSQTAQPAQP